MSAPPNGPYAGAVVSTGVPAMLMAAGIWILATGSGLLHAPMWTCSVAAALSFVLTCLLLVQGRRARAHFAAILDHANDVQRQLQCDPLTGLMNRTAFNKALDELRSIESASGTVMVLFFDLDRFKDVNDTLGHRVGDQLLVEIAQRAGEVLEEAPAFARLGGDEFAAILPVSSSSAAQAYGNSIVSRVNEPIVIDHHSVNVAASVGIAIGDTMLDDGHELLRRADTAMYEAKGAPRGRCRIFDDKLHSQQIHEGFVRVELGRSLLENTLCLHYQPLIDARSGLMSSAEALLRTDAHALATVDTATLVSIAEKSGQIIQLTEWTMETAFAAIRALQTTPIALNVSPVYFRQPHFVNSIVDRLLQTDTPPELLTLEITEGVLIGDIELARESISRLREIGIRVYLDDFGTAYSSLSYLQHFELDGLKLDKTFLRNVGDENKSRRVIKSMIDFGHSLDMLVVVEGVESDWQARLLQLLGCDYLQGYEFGAAMPLHELRLAREHLARSAAADRHPLQQGPQIPSGAAGQEQPSR